MQRRSNSATPYSATGLTLLAIIGALAANLAIGLSRIDTGARELVDTDGYMRFARILDLVEGRNGWFDGSINWSNSPFGHSMHWTRPLDAIVVALATMGVPFVGWRDAVYWAGLVSGPLLHVVFVIVVVWVARRLMARPAAALAGCIAGLQPIVVGYTVIGRLDHHLLVTVLAIAALGATLHSLSWTPRPAALAGCLSGLCLWVSTEGLLPVGVSVATLGTWWVLRGGRLDVVRAWVLALLVTMAGALALEHGPGDLAGVEYDRISLVHLLAGAAVGAGISILVVLVRRFPNWQRRAGGRLASVAVATVVPALCVVGAFPRLLDGPFAEVPPRVWDVWLSHVSESRPVWAGATPVRSIVVYLGTPTLGLVAAGLLARRRRGDGRWLWATVVVWLAVLIPLAAQSARLALYPCGLAALPLGAATWVVIMRWGRGSSIGHVAARMCAVLASVVGTTAVAGLAGIGAGGEASSSANWSTDCELAAVGAAIERELPNGAAVLAHLDLGPVLHVVTGRDVIATPHHRNVAGILDGFDIMRSSLASARRIVGQRGIDAIVLCPVIDQIYLSPVPDGSLYAALGRDEPPTWLHKVELDGDRARLFVVIP